jgi:hypothetical protein
MVTVDNPPDPHLYCLIMAKKKTVKLNTAPQYPTDDQAKTLAEIQRLDVFEGTNPRTHFARADYSQTISALATWGVKNIFFVYAFPPAGFDIEKPEDVLNLQTFEGWIFQYVPLTDRYNLLVKASRDGVAFFKAQRDSYK